MAVNQEIRQIAEIIRQTVPAERIYLFGSHAYGQPRADSDYDFFVVLSDGGMLPLKAEQEIHWALAQSPLRTPVDVLAAPVQHFERMKKYNSLERKVDREGVLLYGRV